MFFEIHSHSHFSNLRLLDSINKPKNLIDRAIELGLTGITITDHECLSSHMEVNLYAKELQKTNPNFTVALGNEIYLIDERATGQKYYHFILIAKDEIGHKALRELSSTAWYNSYSDYGLRVPTTKSELTAIVKKYKGHLIASTACLGGEISTNLIALTKAESVGDVTAIKKSSQSIIDFIQFCKNLFEDDFYIECAPSMSEDQLIVNLRLEKIAKSYGIKLVFGTDAHYLSKEDRFVHKAYLQSQPGEREVDAFYEFSHLMNIDEAIDMLEAKGKGLSLNTIYEMVENSNEIKDKISFYSLEKNQRISSIDLTEYPICKRREIDPGLYPTLDMLLHSKNNQERYWINECIIALKDNVVGINPEYLARLEIEADVITFIGNKLDICLYAYFNTFKHYIDIFWECGSIVGPGRGSATGFLSNYLLGITQLDPIRWGLPYWRFLNKERAELPDIDIDLAPSKRPAIFERIRAERGEMGIVQVATFGTEGTKSTVLTACRGYRSEQYPDGVDSDIAQFMSSLIPQHRGFLWSLHDVVHGNPEEDRAPVKIFIKEVEKYPGLLDIMLAIEGLINKRSSHASGVILYDEDPYETSAFMRTPSGDLVTQFDLHMAEKAGDTKYDFLATEVSDKMIKAIDLLIEEKVIENLSLRESYNKYLHPEVIDTTDPRLWESLAAGNVLDVFQFNSGTGLAVAKKVKPQNPIEMTAANALMRLMSEKGQESQQDRFSRIKQQGIEVFHDEMKKAGLTEKQQAAMSLYCDEYYGCVPLQEQMMQILMHEDLANFTLAEANDARKIVAKKQMSRIPELKEKMYSKIKGDKTLADYIWKTAVAPSLGYAFSLNHSLPYSFVGLQTIYLAVNFNPIFWNTACLIVNSGSTDEENGGSADYGKIATAIGDIINAGIKVSLIDINKSGFGFRPDIDNNQILFGLKALIDVGDEIVKTIIEGRPYSNFYDFVERINPNKRAMISLIKSGAFDRFEDRKFIMGLFIWMTCDKKKRLTLQNFNGLIQAGLIPEELSWEKRIYNFNKYLKAKCKVGTTYFKLDAPTEKFYFEYYGDVGIDYLDDAPHISQKKWDNIYQGVMNGAREWLKANHDLVLDIYNKQIFKADWDKYAGGSLSAWEMESVCFYYHEHELVHLKTSMYGIVDFFELNPEPDVERTWTKNGITYPLYHLYKICGTCIAKNKTKGTVSLLTTSGVVTVKFRNEYFSLFDKQISERQSDGTKKIVEKSWFGRGNMIMVQGIRRGDEFIAKKYSTSPGHQLYRLEQIDDKGEIILQSERYQGGLSED